MVSMETKSKERFFIVLRGKARKGFTRGCIGQVEAETDSGEVRGLLYNASGNNAVSPKSGGLVRKEDTYPLTRHQAQLLLFIISMGRRLELLCNPQLFAAICELTQDDLVVVRHKKGHMPALVRNLMLVGKKQNQEDLNMLGFEVEFMDSEQTLSNKKPAALSLFNAGDIVQVVPSYSVPYGLHLRDNQSNALNKREVARINSLPNFGSRGLQLNTNNQSVNHENRATCQPPPPLEVGSLVEVVSSLGVTVYGVIRWLGVPTGKTNEWAGIELDYDVSGCSDGMYGAQRYFTCSRGRALFVPVTKCCPDSRFVSSSTGTRTLKPMNSSLVPPFEDSEEHVPPIPENEVTTLLLGKLKGIQGHFNSCYLDATLFSLFSTSTTLDDICTKPGVTEKPVTCTLRKIINRLRRQGFVPAESVMNLRKQLGCDTFQTEEKDSEEFITILFQDVLCIEPLLKLRSRGGTSQGAYTYQIFLEKEQIGQTPTVQQLVDTSFLSGDLKFEEVPSCLMVQMPRFGNKYKMFPHIIPSTQLDITDLLHNSPRECFVCGQLAEHECLQCLPDRKLQPGTIKQYCTTCNTQIHTHPSRQGHSPCQLAVPTGVPADSPVPRHVMHLFAVLCIHTSHYVSFVKYGADPHSWLFFDCMADRSGDDQSGFNIPEIRACPELGDFLSQSEDDLTQANPSQAGELVRRLLCDSYMFFYQTP